MKSPRRKSRSRKPCSARQVRDVKTHKCRSPKKAGRPRRVGRPKSGCKAGQVRSPSNKKCRSRKRAGRPLKSRSRR